MKRKRLALIILLALACVLCTVFAFGCSDKATYYTVTFMDGQTQVGESVKVQKGKKIADYPTAARSDENYVFDGWFKDEELNKVWNGDIERVTKDITLWANFLYVPATPSNVAMGGGAFSNTVTWLQRNITADTDFTVEIVGTDITSGGKAEFAFESYKGHTDIYTVQWTPAQKPLGGEYSVKITSGTDAGKTYENLFFKGAGVEKNPYLITSATDLAAVNAQDIAAGNYYKLAQSFTARLSANDVAGKTFNGNLNGNGKTITLEASDIGLFGALGQNAEVKDLTVAGAVANVQTNCVGAIASVNRGKITYCTVSASLDSAVGSVGTLSGDKDGIEGGIAGVAGINYGEISCCTYSGTVKANVGGAGIAVINNGTVSLCSFTGTIGAGNSNETGNSTKAYSYIGGIVAINYKVVEKSSTDGSGKLLAQRGEGGLNDYVGGIVAVNQANATVSECWFDGIRVHGNKNVGGIAGANAGTISHCYAGGDYHSGSRNHSYVGGMSEVGGIVGLSQSGGTVKNCFVTSNVYAYSGNAYKVAQTSLNSVYVGGNLDNRSGTVTVKADENNGNIAIALSGDFSGKDYPLVLSDEQLSALNGESQLFTDKTNVRLVCEDESTVIEHNIVLSIDGTEIATLSSVSGNSVSLKEYAPENVPAGHYFAGWAVTENGQAVFEENEQVNYTALANYGAERVTLYPVFIEGEKPQSKVLSVALWTRYVQEDTARALFEAFKASAYFEDGYEVVYTALSSSNNANYKTDYESGEYNVAFAYKATAVDAWQTSIKQIYIFSVNDNAYTTLKVGLNSSDDVVVAFGQFLETETAKKIMNPAFVTEDEADKIQITLMNGDTQYGEKFTVSNATEAKKATLPEIENVPSGYVSFLGWATTQTAVENETLLTGSIGYSDVESLATGGALTLYARFSEEEKQVEIKVAVYKKFIDQPIVDALTEAFTKYCTENSIKCDTLQIDLMTDGNGGAFTSDAAGYDVAVGHKGGTSFTSLETLTVAMMMNAANGGKVASDRKAERLTDSDIAKTFMAFLQTDAGKKALIYGYISEAEADTIEITLMNGDTQYGEKLTVSNATDAAGVTLPAVEGDNFAGWAITQSAVENETLLTGNKSYADLSQYATEQKLTLYARFTETPQKPSVVIAIHSSASSTTYITAEEVEKIKSDFVSYLTSKDYTDYDIDWFVVTGKNAAGFDTAVSGYEKTVNVAVGGNTMGLTFDGTYGKVDVKSGLFANTSRKVGLLSGSESNGLAVLFYQFMTGVETE